MWNLILKKKETYIQNRKDLQLLKANLQLPKGKHQGRDKSEAWGEHTHTRTHTHTHTPTIFKIDNQHRPTVQHRELYPIFCNNQYENRI